MLDNFSYNKNSRIRGGQPREAGCMNPNAENFEPIATVDDGSCIFTEPINWSCPPYWDHLTECSGPATTTQQTILFLCANRNDCLLGCSGGANDGFTCWCDDCGGFGYLWNNADCCGDYDWPINSPYWSMNGDMNFPLTPSAPWGDDYYSGWDGPSWDPYDSIFFVNCGINGDECPEDPFSNDFYYRICSHVYLPHGGLEDAINVMGQFDDPENFNPSDVGIDTPSFINSYGFSTAANMNDGSEYSTFYCQVGAPVHMMIYKRALGLFYRTDVDNELIFPVGLKDAWQWLNWSDDSESEFIYENLSSYYTKVLPMGGVQYVGCTDPTASNYDGLATIMEDGMCFYHTEGCTDPMCSNYNPDATIDDGSCVDCEYTTGPDSPAPPEFDQPIGACTHPYAINYYCLDPTPYDCILDEPPGNVYDNGSCEFGEIDVPCEMDTECQYFGSTYRCCNSVCTNMPGDVDGDCELTYVDICLMAMNILQQQIYHEYCEGVTFLPITPANMTYGDLNLDGEMDVLDIVAAKNLMIYYILSTIQDTEIAQGHIERLNNFVQSDWSSGDSHGDNGYETCEDGRCPCSQGLAHSECPEGSCCDNTGDLCGMDQCCSYSDGYYGQPWEHEWMYGEVCIGKRTGKKQSPGSPYQEGGVTNQENKLKKSVRIEDQDGRRIW